MSRNKSKAKSPDRGEEEELDLSLTWKPEPVEWEELSLKAWKPIEWKPEPTKSVKHGEK